MTEPIQIAIVGFSGVMIGAVITALIMPIITGIFSKKIESQKFNYQLIAMLYEKRFLTYIKILEITQDIGKNVEDVDLCQSARKELKEWQKSSGGFLLMSNKALNDFNALKDVLKKNPEKKSAYSEKQRENIFHARNSFRGSLRDEFVFFSSAEDSKK